jgi:hypothetical protein
MPSLRARVCVQGLVFTAPARIRCAYSLSKVFCQAYFFPQSYLDPRTLAAGSGARLRGFVHTSQE